MNTRDDDAPTEYDLHPEEFQFCDEGHCERCGEYGPLDPDTQLCECCTD